MKISALCSAILLLCIATAGESLELRIPYTVIRSEIESQFFPGGRSYLSGDRSSTCEYAYLENPSLFGQDGRLALQAQFHGKTGKEVLGKCVGTGKSFDIVITGRPEYREGKVRFEDAQIQLRNRVADAVFGKLLDRYAEDLERDLVFPLQSDMQRLSDTVNRGIQGYQLRVDKFSLSAIDVRDSELVLRIDASLVVNSGSE